MANTKASFSKSANEEVINHYGAVRLRVAGSANLNLTLFSLDEVVSSSLASIALQSVNNIEPNRLSNFTQQRAKLEIRTTEINEIFQLSKAIVFVRPVAKSYPE
jgi:hypothetical protein